MNIKWILKLSSILLVSVISASCVTKTVESTSIRINEAAVVSVGDSSVSMLKGSLVAWLPEAVLFYEDKRLDNTPLKSLIEKEIVKNIKQQGMIFVDSVNGAKYAIAYTAALESSLDDATIIRRYGLLPGIPQLPKKDSNVEKGSLIIYVYEVRSNVIIWRSAAQAGVAFDMSMEQRKARIVSVLGKMFQTFPVEK